MKKTLGIMGAAVVWTAVIAYLVLAGGYSRRQRAAVEVTEVRIAISDSSATRVINRSMVQGWLHEGGFDPVGKPVREVNLQEIEDFLSVRTEVRRVGAWTDLNGVLTVQVVQRNPIMRVRSVNGYRFWVTDDNYLLADNGQFSGYVPVITGVTPFPFPVTARGSYDDMLAANYEDFHGQYMAIDAERRSLAAQRAQVRAQYREQNAKRPKRFWSEYRKKDFRETKSRNLAELQDRANELDAALTALSVRKEELREKEKKSLESHNFLTKLVNFVKSIENDDFWGAQIVQINVLGDGGGTWKEPQIELIPRAGDHTVLLGRLDGSEKHRMDKLKLFYRNGLWHEGWNEYRYLNLKYNGQIVCTK